MNKKNAGFTLVELLIVVVILGILSGLTMNVINTGRQRKVTEDAVRRSNIEKLSQAIEAFCTGEGRCPLATEISFGAASTPTLATNVGIYVKQWPVSTFNTTVADIKYSYYTDSATTPKDFEVSVKMMSSSATRYLRYNSSWGQIMDCSDVVSGTWGVTCTP